MSQLSLYVCLFVFHTWVWCNVTRGRVCNMGLESVVTMNGARVADSVVANSVVANSVVAVLLPPVYRYEKHTTPSEMGVQVRVF